MPLQELICQFEVRYSHTDNAQRSVPNIGEESFPIQGKVRHLDLSVTDLERKGGDSFHKTEARDQVG